MKRLIFYAITFNLFFCKSAQENPETSVSREAIDNSKAQMGENNDKMTLAILPVKADKSLSENEKELIASYFEGEIIQYNTYKIVDRISTKKLLAEMQLDQAGILTDKQRNKVGQLLSAKYILTSQLSKIDKKIAVTCRIVAVESGQVIGSGMGKVSSMAKVDGAAKGCIRRMTGRM